MSKLKSLQSADTLHDLANLLGFKPKMLAYLIYKQPPSTRYTTFEIDKRSGGKRKIDAPNKRLKLLQARLAGLLQDCIEEIRVARGTDDMSRKPDRLAHGFRRGRSIATNAQRHRHRRYVFNVDLKDFFPACNFGRVRGVLMKDRNYALNPKIAAAIAQASCHDGALAQGSPASPCLSNIVAQILDIRLAALAARAGCVYSRYADDLTFSTNKPTFPEEIAKTGGAFHDWEAGDLLVEVIRASGFEINPGKTRMQYRKSRQEVTGLVVNERVNIKREYRHTVRAMVDRVLKTGAFEHVVRKKDASGSVIVSKTAGTLEQLQGMLGFMDAVDTEFRVAPLPKTEKGEKRVFPAHTLFLFFTNFYACSRATIIGEGKTDNVYLTHAIRSLAALCPRLATVGAGGKVEMLVRLLKYAGRSTGKKVGLMGGAGDLKNFIRDYKAAMTDIKGPGLTHPVIVLVDSDKAGNEVKKAAIGMNALKTPIVLTDTFYWIYGNLYQPAEKPIKMSLPTARGIFFSTREAMPCDAGVCKAPESRLIGLFLTHLPLHRHTWPADGGISLRSRTRL